MWKIGILYRKLSDFIGYILLIDFWHYHEYTSFLPKAIFMISMCGKTLLAFLLEVYVFGRLMQIYELPFFFKSPKNI